MVIQMLLAYYPRTMLTEEMVCLSAWTLSLRRIAIFFFLKCLRWVLSFVHFHDLISIKQSFVWLLMKVYQMKNIEKTIFTNLIYNFYIYHLSVILEYFSDRIFAFNFLNDSLLKIEIPRKSFSRINHIQSVN